MDQENRLCYKHLSIETMYIWFLSLFHNKVIKAPLLLRMIIRKPKYEKKMGKRGRIRSDIEKRFYNREAITALNYDMMQMSFIPLSLLCTQIVNPLLNSMISANHDKVDGL